MRKGEENGRVEEKEVGNRRPKASKPCEIFTGGHLDHRYVRCAVWPGYIRRFAAQQNPIPLFQQMLACLDIEGKTITAGAMHCQRETTCRRVIQRKGDYLFGLKENQPSLLEDVRLFFESAGEKESDRFQTVEQNAGRIEKRICHKIKDISWLKELKWPGLRSVFSITRCVEVRGHSSKEANYYIASREDSPGHLMSLAREHWKIESMHWLLDVTFSEDSSRLLCENANRNMNALRKFALAVHKNFLAVHHKRPSIKAHVLSALLYPNLLLDILHFLCDGHGDGIFYEKPFCLKVSPPARRCPNPNP